MTTKTLKTLKVLISIDVKNIETNFTIECKNTMEAPYQIVYVTDARETFDSLNSMNLKVKDEIYTKAFMSKYSQMIREYYMKEKKTTRFYLMSKRDMLKAILKIDGDVPIPIMRLNNSIQEWVEECLMILKEEKRDSSSLVVKTTHSYNPVAIEIPSRFKIRLSDMQVDVREREVCILKDGKSMVYITSDNVVFDIMKVGLWLTMLAYDISEEKEFTHFCTRDDLRRPGCRSDLEKLEEDLHLWADIYRDDRHKIHETIELAWELMPALSDIKGVSIETMLTKTYITLKEQTVDQTSLSEYFSSKRYFGTDEKYEKTRDFLIDLQKIRLKTASIASRDEEIQMRVQLKWFFMKMIKNNAIVSDLINSMLVSKEKMDRINGESLNQIFGDSKSFTKAMFYTQITEQALTIMEKEFADIEGLIEELNYLEKEKIWVPFEADTWTLLRISETRDDSMETREYTPKHLPEKKIVWSYLPTKTMDIFNIYPYQDTFVLDKGITATSPGSHTLVDGKGSPCSISFKRLSEKEEREFEEKEKLYLKLNKTQSKLQNGKRVIFDNFPSVDKIPFKSLDMRDGRTVLGPEDIVYVNMKGSPAYTRMKTAIRMTCWFEIEDVFYYIRPRFRSAERWVFKYGEPDGMSLEAIHGATDIIYHCHKNAADPILQVLLSKRVEDIIRLESAMSIGEGMYYDPSSSTVYSELLAVPTHSVPNLSNVVFASRVVVAEVRPMVKLPKEFPSKSICKGSYFSQEAGAYLTCVKHRSYPDYMEPSMEKKELLSAIKIPKEDLTLMIMGRMARWNSDRRSITIGDAEYFHHHSILFATSSSYYLFAPTLIPVRSRTESKEIDLIEILKLTADIIPISTMDILEIPHEIIQKLFVHLLVQCGINAIGEHQSVDIDTPNPRDVLTIGTRLTRFYMTKRQYKNLKKAGKRMPHFKKNILNEGFTEWEIKTSISKDRAFVNFIQKNYHEYMALIVGCPEGVFIENPGSHQTDSFQSIVDFMSIVVASEFKRRDGSRNVYRSMLSRRFMKDTMMRCILGSKTTPVVEESKTEENIDFFNDERSLKEQVDDAFIQKVQHGKKRIEESEKMIKLLSENRDLEAFTDAKFEVSEDEEEEGLNPDMIRERIRPDTADVGINARVEMMRTVDISAAVVRERSTIEDVVRALKQEQSEDKIGKKLRIEKEIEEVFAQRGMGFKSVGNESVFNTKISLFKDVLPFVLEKEGDSALDAKMRKLKMVPDFSRMLWDWHTKWKDLIISDSDWIKYQSRCERELITIFDTHEKSVYDIPNEISSAMIDQTELYMGYDHDPSMIKIFDGLMEYGFPFIAFLPSFWILCQNCPEIGKLMAEGDPYYEVSDPSMLLVREYSLRMQYPDFFTTFDETYTALKRRFSETFIEFGILRGDFDVLIEIWRSRGKDATTLIRARDETISMTQEEQEHRKQELERELDFDYDKDEDSEYFDQDDF